MVLDSAYMMIPVLVLPGLFICFFVLAPILWLMERKFKKRMNELIGRLTNQDVVATCIDFYHYRNYLKSNRSLSSSDFCGCYVVHSDVTGVYQVGRSKMVISRLTDYLKHNEVTHVRLVRLSDSGHYELNDLYKEVKQYYSEKTRTSMLDMPGEPFTDEMKTKVDTYEDEYYWTPERVAKRQRIEAIRKKQAVRREFRHYEKNGMTVTSDEFEILRNDYKTSNVLRLKDFAFSGCYIFRNLTKDGKCYVGQSLNVPNRVNQHLSGHGSSGLFLDYSYGDEFTITMIKLDHTKYETLDELETDLIAYHEAYETGYNKTRGNGRKKTA